MSQTTAEVVTNTTSPLHPLFCLLEGCETLQPVLRGSESGILTSPTTVTYLVSAQDMHHLKCVYVWDEVMRSPPFINMHCEREQLGVLLPYFHS